jgi:putative transposase
MPTGLHRFYESHDLHFITFSCFRRMALLGTPERRDLFVTILEQVRQQYNLVVHGYVAMPEHVHLLMINPERGTPSTVVQVVKQRTARPILQEIRRAGGSGGHLWQERFYDFNVWSARKQSEKLAYMHHNPVKRGLVSRPEDWRWSSCRYYATGEQGVVKVNVQERPLKIGRIAVQEFAG